MAYTISGGNSTSSSSLFISMEYLHSPLLGYSSDDSHFTIVKYCSFISETGSPFLSTSVLPNAFSFLFIEYCPICFIISNSLFSFNLLNLVSSKLQSGYVLHEYPYIFGFPLIVNKLAL